MIPFSDDTPVEPTLLADTPNPEEIPSASTPTPRGWRWLFGRPKLPALLFFVFVFIVLVEMLFTLIGQQQSYWVNHAIGAGTVWGTDKLLQISPWAFVGATLAYLALLWLVQRLLHYRITIVLWMILSALHLRDGVAWGRCSFLKTFEWANSCNNIDGILMAVMAGVLGIAVAWALWPAGAEAPPQRPNAQSRSIPYFFIGFATITGLALLGWLGYTITQPVEGWIAITPATSPPERFNAPIAYDSDRQVAILFGGKSSSCCPQQDTWEWNGTTWIDKTLDYRPPPRSGHGLVYDPIRKETVMFGGCLASDQFGNDTWIWNGGYWAPRHSENIPPARCSPQMFYDPNREEIILHGGFATTDEQSHFFDDVWAWNGEDWRPIETDEGSIYATGSTPALNIDTQQIIAFMHTGTTWEWQTEGYWTLLDPPTQPAGRNDMGLAYNPLLGEFVMHGGNLNSTPSNDLWLYDGSEWREIKLPYETSQLWGHTMFYDQRRQKLIIFGGYDGREAVNTMWALHLPQE